MGPAPLAGHLADRWVPLVRASPNLQPDSPGTALAAATLSARPGRDLRRSPRLPPRRQAYLREPELSSHPFATPSSLALRRRSGASASAVVLLRWPCQHPGEPLPALSIHPGVFLRLSGHRSSAPRSPACLRHPAPPPPPVRTPAPPSPRVRAWPVLPSRWIGRTATIHPRHPPSFALGPPDHLAWAAAH